MQDSIIQTGMTPPASNDYKQAKQVFVRFLTVELTQEQLDHYGQVDEIGREARGIGIQNMEVAQLDYFNDLNAIRRVELKLSEAQRGDYGRVLELAYLKHPAEVPYQWWVLTLDAEARARAAYEVLK